MSAAAKHAADWQAEMKARHRAGYRLTPDARLGAVWSRRVGPLTWRIVPTGAYHEEARA